MAGLHVPATATMKGRTKLCLFPPSPRSGQGLLSRAVDGSPLYQATNMSGITIDGLRSNPVEALPDPKRSWSRSSWDVIIDESLSPIPGDESRDARRKPQACHKRTYSTNSSSSGYTGDEDQLLKTSSQQSFECYSRSDIQSKTKFSLLSMTILALSVYSTLWSGAWLIISIRQPRWGWFISSTGWMAPSTASLLTALISKTIEMSFVTVFVSFIGQALTRRALVRESKGMTLAEMMMRNWVIQPGSLLTHWQSLPSAAMTILGAVTMMATAAAILYTTASDALVSPKLKFGASEQTVLQGYLMSSYANPNFVRVSCATPISNSTDPSGGNSCLDVQYSGNSYHNLLVFMSTWHDINVNGINAPDDIALRPPGTANLYDNTTLTAAWIEAGNSNVTANFERYGRIINNITLAIPHPGVYAAATNPINNILQPDDLSGVGEYIIRATAVSPAVNVMCVNMEAAELAPLVYTEWPNAKVNTTGVPGQRIGFPGWKEDVPPTSASEWYNQTVVDDIFRWGAAYQRAPPVFQLYPLDYNTITNTTVYGSDAIYVLGKSAKMGNYTLCELRSWPSPECSTEFNVSGTTGGRLTAHCDDPNDPDSYTRRFPTAKIATSKDWKNLVDEWRISIDLDGGVSNNNASNARLLTELILDEPHLPGLLPSMAEALAVTVSSTLVAGAVGTPFRHFWNFSSTMLAAPGALQGFNASVTTQQYTSSHTSDWQTVFYPVLAAVFATNIFCLAYLSARLRLVTDVTEPANAFALALSSPPSRSLGGSCGAGPGGRDLRVPWKVGYKAAVNHYFFVEAGGSEDDATGAAGARSAGSARSRSSSLLLSPFSSTAVDRSVGGGASESARGGEKEGESTRSRTTMGDGPGWT